MASVDSNTQNVVALGALGALLLFLLNQGPPSTVVHPAGMGLAHGYSVAPASLSAACIPCGQGK